MAFCKFLILEKNFLKKISKGYTDQKEQDAGHMSLKMHKVYNRKGCVVQPADGEEI